MSKPIVFFGSSVEGLPILDELRAGLAHVAYHKPWDRNFPPGSQTLDALRDAALESDFAVFVFGPDDWTESRSVAQQAPRDNVVFEAGLFGGLLGFDRVFIVHEKTVKRPSDLDGFTCITYDQQVPPQYQAQRAIPEIRKVIAAKAQRASRLEGIWWQYHMGPQPAVEQSNLALLKIECQPHAPPKIVGKAWTDKGVMVARFDSKTASTISDPPGVFYYWEGDWPAAPNTPKFHGRGQINLKNPDRASGWYTTESDTGDFTPERFDTEYIRGTEQDLATVESLDAEKRAELINKHLQNRPPFAL